MAFIGLYRFVRRPCAVLYGPRDGVKAPHQLHVERALGEMLGASLPVHWDAFADKGRIGDSAEGHA